MKIWQLKSEYVDYEVFNFVNEERINLFNEHFCGVSMERNWEPPQVFTYQKGKESDFPPGLLSVPVFSEKAVIALGEILEGKGELLPIVTDKNKTYYAFNVLNVLDGIDGDRAEVKRLRSGKIMRYVNYAFKKEVVEGQIIFKTVNHETKNIKNTHVFVTDEFRQKVLECDLEGFDFIEVWDSGEADTAHQPNTHLVDASVGKSFSFEEASVLVKNQGKTVVSDKWAWRLDEDGKTQVGHLQEDGSYLWTSIVHYPPIFLGMRWKEIE
jgi:hypothetical protein